MHDQRICDYRTNHEHKEYVLLWKNRNDIHYAQNPNLLYICGDLDPSTEQGFGYIEWIDLRMHNNSWNLLSTFDPTDGFAPLSLNDIFLGTTDVSKSFRMRKLLK